MLEGKAIKSQVRVLGLQQFYSITCQKISSGHALDSHFVIEILSLESIEFAKKKYICILVFGRVYLMRKCMGRLAFCVFISAMNRHSGIKSFF
jgi:hypothetical protein